MNDIIREDWLRQQEADWNAFAPQTDLVSVTPYDSDSPHRMYIAEFRCRGLVRWPNAPIQEAARFIVGIEFDDDHLRRVSPQLVTLIEPPHVWHPNVRFPLICPGHLRVGVGLIDILYQVHSILTYQNMSVTSYLNPLAADWAREHQAEFPVDTRPLKRREFHLDIQEVK